MQARDLETSRDLREPPVVVSHHEIAVDVGDEQAGRVRAEVDCRYEEIDLRQLDDELLDLASSLEAPLRSLDAVHVAAALELGDELEALVTYDARMQRSAASLGLPVVSPS